MRRELPWVTPYCMDVFLYIATISLLYMVSIYIAAIISLWVTPYIWVCIYIAD